MFYKAIISAAFKALKIFLIERIGYQPVKDFFTRLLNPAEQVAGLLTDSNPNNNQQLAEWWASNKHLVSDIGLDAVKEVIRTKVKDANVREMILALLDSLDGEGNLKPIPAAV